MHETASAAEQSAASPRLFLKVAFITDDESNVKKLAVLAVAAGLALTLPVSSAPQQDPKITVEDVMAELQRVRRELREVKIQQDKDRQTIERLRQTVFEDTAAVSEAVPAQKAGTTQLASSKD